MSGEGDYLHGVFALASSSSRRIRQGEDCGGPHILTVNASDVLTHHLTGDFADIARSLAEQG